MKKNLNDSRFFRILLLAALVLPALASCKKEEQGAGGNEDTPFAFTGQYLVLNNGKWGNNDASLGCWEDQSKTYYPGVFYGVNKQHLGDLGQDMIVYGSKVYIAVSGSKKIFVTDKALNLLQTINPDNCQPRHLEAYNGKVYATLYEGYLAEIDTTSYALRKMEVGDSPEGFAITGGRAYVACSGGMSYPNYGDKMVAVNLGSFTIELYITVNLNPQSVWAANGKVYILSWGNYADVPAKLQVYEYPSVTDTGYSGVYAGALYGDVLYLLCDTSNPDGAQVCRLSTSTGNDLGVFFPSGIQGAYSLSVTKDYLWLGISDYVKPGTMQVWTREGQELYASFGTLGLNPQKVIER